MDIFKVMDITRIMGITKVMGVSKVSEQVPGGAVRTRQPGIMGRLVRSIPHQTVAGEIFGGQGPHRIRRGSQTNCPHIYKYIDQS